MIGGVLRLGSAGGIAEVVRQPAAKRALGDGFLESTDSGVELLRRERSRVDELVENLRWNGRQGARQADLSACGG